MKVISVFICTFFLLLVPILSFAQALNPPTWINDGPGGDVDYWTNASSFQANWAEVTFPTGATIDDWQYSWRITHDDILLVEGVINNGTSNPPETLSTTISPQFTSNVTYRLEIRADYHISPFVAAPEWIEGTTWGYSDGFLVDTAAPVSTMGALDPYQYTTSFTVTWSATDGESGVANYDVQYRINSGTWTTWLNQTTQTSAVFSGSNNNSYSFRARATDNAGNTGNYSTIQTTSIAPVPTALPTAPPPAQIPGAGLTLSTNPISLSFSAQENSVPLSLSIQATGTGMVSVTSLDEARTYPQWGTETGIPESLSLSIPGGTTRTLQRMVTLSPQQRIKALGTSTTGSFSLHYTLSGTDGMGNPISASIAVPVTVSSGPSTTLSIQSIDLNLPASPWYVGDSVQNATITIHATGNGNVTGRVLVDGSTAWSPASGFSVYVNNTTTFPLGDSLPTTTTGNHTVTAELTSPVSLIDEETYTVTDQTAPFPPTSLILVDNVAVLSNFSGSAVATTDTQGGYVEFDFSGTADMQLVSLHNTTLQQASVSHLLVRYEDSAPTVARIRGGHVIKEAAGNEVLVQEGANHFRIKKAEYIGQSGTPTDHILVDARLYVPKLDTELIWLRGLQVRAQGIEGKTISLTPAQAEVFDAFGMSFSIHDTPPANQAITVAYEPSLARYGVTLAGSIIMEEKISTTIYERDLGNFGNLTFYTDGQVSGTVNFQNPYSLITDYLQCDGVTIRTAGSQLVMDLKGTFSGLLPPLDYVTNVAFSYTFNKAGDVISKSFPVSELVNNFQGHARGGSDTSEWDFLLGTMDFTHVGPALVFQQGRLLRDQSAVNVGLDLYLNVKTANNSTPSDADRRLSFGNLDQSGTFVGGFNLLMDGTLVTNPPDDTGVLINYRLVLGSLRLKIEQLGMVQDPLAVLLTGELAIDMNSVDSDISIENLMIGLDGTLYNLSDAIMGGSVEVAEIVRMNIEDINVSLTPETLTFSADSSIGSGDTRTFAQSEKTVQVQSYIQLLGATVNVGLTSKPILSGGFDGFTLFKPQSGPDSFVLQGAQLKGIGVEVKADVEYVNSLLRLSGEIKLPGNIKAIAVGKMGMQNNDFTMGIFVAASGLKMAVGPGVFLDEIGGGFFINPVEEDLQLVRHLAKFTRPEMSDEIQEKRPGGLDNPGEWALMLLGGFYVSSKDTLKGRALLTITSNYFNLDAEVSYLTDLLQGKVYLAVGWDPAYAEGVINIKMNFLKIIRGEGNLEFYVYSSDTWGVNGDFNVSLLGQEIASGSMFLGPPGFMLEAEVSIGIDLVIVSGHISYGGMFWYNAKANPKTWGAYASVEVSGEFLKGLLGATARLEGALIGAPQFVIYAVGTVKFKVCYITVFEGSLWISVGENGLHGGTGRNDHYDGLIEDARNMADQMNQAKDELTEDLEQAKLDLVHLNEEQLQAAGTALVDRGGIIGGLVELIFQYNEIDRWNNNLPASLQVVNNELFGPDHQSLTQVRSELLNLQNSISSKLAALETLQQAVGQSLEDYQDLLLEDLPSISDLGTQPNPFKGMDTKTVSIGGNSKTIVSGFRINENQAETQRDKFSNIREDFAEYQEAFITQAGIIDAKLQQLDEILFMNENNLNTLSMSFGEEYTLMTDHLDRFVRFQGENYDKALASLSAIQTRTSESLVRAALTTKANSTNASTLTSWNNDRKALINALVSVGHGQAQTFPEGLTPAQLFIETGAELWWNIPVAGFEASRDLSPQRRAQALATFKANADTFRSKWVAATQVMEQVFDRKSQLYDILYEIYDQLAVYGSGMIGIEADGDAAGFGGIAGIGLGYRTNAVAGAVLSESMSLPPGAAFPDTPTVGPLRPVTPVTQSQAIIQPQAVEQTPAKKKHSMLQKDTGEFETADSRDDRGYTGNSSDADGLASATIPGETYLVCGFTDYSGYSGYINLKDLFFTVPVKSSSGSTTIVPAGNSTPGIKNSGSTVKKGRISITFENVVPDIPAAGQFKREIPESTTKEPAVAWIAVTRYFEVKRGEIGPYLEIPVITQFSGTISSETEYDAFLLTSFSASHPVGVVEYAYKIEPVPASQEQSATNSGKSSRGRVIEKYVATESPMMMTMGSTDSGSQPRESNNTLQFMTGINLMSVLILRPWFSIGTLNEIREPFFPDIHTSGNYYLYLRARGAGGKTIVRRATLTLDFFDPATDSSPVISQINTSDNTPPAAPLISLSGPFNPKQDMVYGAWQASDPESGIQNYEYGIASYSESVSDSGKTLNKEYTPGIESNIDNIISLENSSGPPPDILGWTNAGGRLEANIRGLSLLHGNRYVIKVRATNGVGLKTVGTSGPFLVDTTPPVNLAIGSFTQTNADGFANSVSFTVQFGDDPESGILSHSFALGTTQGGMDLYEWTELQTQNLRVANIPVSHGSTVYLSVQATNGAGTTSVVKSSLALVYTDTTPPPAPQVVILPEGFAQTVDSLHIGWSFANDPQSGIVSYEYGIGTSLTNADVVSWKSVPLHNKAYIIGQGQEELFGESTESGKEKSPGKKGTIIEGFNSGLSPKQTNTLQADFIVEEQGFTVTHNQHYYGLVRVTNGKNLQSIGASEALTIDTTGPDSVTITCPEQSTDTTRIPLHITAGDSQSGIAAYRYAVWKYTYTSRIPEDDGYIHEAGFVSQGMITGTFQSQGNLYNNLTEQALGSEQFYENLDPSMLESLLGPPWFERGWHTISNGINPSGINMNLDLTGFPTHGLQPGNTYKIKVWVKNGAGIEKVSNTAVVYIKELPTKETIKIKPRNFK